MLKKISERVLYFAAAIIFIYPIFSWFFGASGDCGGVGGFACLAFFVIIIFTSLIALLLFMAGRYIGSRGSYSNNAGDRRTNTKKVSSAFLLLGLLIILLGWFKVYRFIDFDDELDKVLNLFLYLIGGVILLSGVQSLWKAWKK